MAKRCYSKSLTAVCHMEQDRIRFWYEGLNQRGSDEFHSANTGTTSCSRMDGPARKGRVQRRTTPVNQPAWSRDLERLQLFRSRSTRLWRHERCKIRQAATGDRRKASVARLMPESRSAEDGSPDARSAVETSPDVIQVELFRNWTWPVLSISR